MSNRFRTRVPAILLIAALLPGLNSCKRLPLYDMVDNVEVRFDFDLSENDPAMHKKPAMPSLMKVIFYDPQTHDRVNEMYCNAGGGKVAGLMPGKYDMVAFNYDTEITEVSGEEFFTTIKAYTSSVRMDTNTLGTVIREPDHLVAGRIQSLEIPYLTEEDATYVIRTQCTTIMDSYTLQVDSLKGLENITSVDVYLTGHSGCNHFGLDERSGEPVSLHIPCGVDLQNQRLFTKFNTFGKIPGIGGKAILHILVTGAGGRTYDFSDDITEQYQNPAHEIKLWFKGEIKPREQSGFDPSVGDWDDETIDIGLQ